VETPPIYPQNPPKYWVLPVDKLMLKTLKLNKKVVDNLPLNE
jgi:hypothetical protein